VQIWDAVTGLDKNIFEDYVSWRETMQKQGVETSSYPLMVSLDYELNPYELHGRMEISKATINTAKGSTGQYNDTMTVQFDAPYKGSYNLVQNIVNSQ
jgi:hypothetical protein